MVKYQLILGNAIIEFTSEALAQAYRAAHGNGNETINTITVEDPIPDYEALATARIKKRMVDAEDLIAAFGARNSLEGITSDQVVELAMGLTTISTLMRSGAFETTASELSIMEPFGFLTQERIDYFKAKLVEYMEGE